MLGRHATGAFARRLAMLLHHAATQQKCIQRIVRDELAVLGLSLDDDGDNFGAWRYNAEVGCDNTTTDLPVHLVVDH